MPTKKAKAPNRINWDFYVINHTFDERLPASDRSFTNTTE